MGADIWGKGGSRRENNCAKTRINPLNYSKFKIRILSFKFLNNSVVSQLREPLAGILTQVWEIYHFEGADSNLGSFLLPLQVQIFTGQLT